MRYFHLLILLCFISFLLACCGGGSGGGSSTTTPSTPVVETYIPPPRPGMSEVYSVVYNAGEVTLTGTGFGTKPVAAPMSFNDMESETIGNRPSDQITNIAEWGTVQNNIKRGTKSLEFDYCADYAVIAWTSSTTYTAGKVVSYGGSEYTVLNTVVASATPDTDPTNYSLGSAALVCANGKRESHWRRNAIDLGSGKDKIYFSAWVYLDKGASTSTSWQWKSFTITSSAELYYDLSPTYPNTNLPFSSYAYNTTTAFTGYWYLGNSYWGNTHADAYYYDYATSRNKDGMIIASSPSDALLWNQWQRLEFYAQRSSSGGVADGIWREQRVGRSTPTFERNNVITHLTGNDAWRYVALSHAIHSVYTGYLDLNIYMDDIYIDTTQARVEIGNNPVWGLCTHREIQIPTSWSSTQIKVNFRKGSFNSGDTVYFFVVDSNDTVNRVGGSFVVP